MAKAALFGTACCTFLLIPLIYPGQIPLFPTIYLSRGHYGLLNHSLLISINLASIAFEV
jgi:hypothetical protein